MLTVRPIRFTPHVGQWRSLLTDLGCAVAVDAGDWVELRAAGGAIALHRAATAETRLGLVTDDLEAAAAEAAEAAGADLHRIRAEHGPAIQVSCDDGIQFLIDVAGSVDAAGAVDAAGTTPGADSAPPRPDAALSVLPLHYTPAVEDAAALYRALGLWPRISSDSGDWVDFEAPGGGLMAVHRDATARVELAFEYAGDVRALAEWLRGRNREAAVIDENYGFSLRLPNPDDGTQIWVNQRQSDLHGYRRAEP